MYRRLAVLIIFESFAAFFESVFPRPAAYKNAAPAVLVSLIRGEDLANVDEFRCERAFKLGVRCGRHRSVANLGPKLPLHWIGNGPSTNGLLDRSIATKGR